MKTLLMGILVFCSSSVFAEVTKSDALGAGASVCELIHSKERGVPTAKPDTAKETPPLFKYLLKVLFAPSRLVKMQKIENQLAGISGRDQVKYAFLTPKVVSLSNDERTSYKTFKKNKKDLNHHLEALGFREGVKKSRNYQECIRFISTRPQIEQNLQSLQDLIESHLTLMAKFHDETVSKEIASKIKYLKRKKWIIFQNKNLNEIHSLIRLKRPHSVLLLSHSSPEGKLFDSESNVLPDGFFESVADVVSNLIIYSCYPEEVIKNYQILNLSQKMNYFFPQSEKEFAFFFGENTPVMALESISAITLDIKKRTEEQSLCTFRLDRPLQAEFSFFLNGTFVASGVGVIAFSCHLLHEENRLQIFSTIKTDSIGSLGISQVLLNNREYIPLKEFISKTTNRHIVTKGSFTYRGDTDENF